MSTTSADLLSALRERSDASVAAPIADQGGIHMPMRDLFAVAKSHRQLPLAEVGTILDHADGTVRLSGVCVLDFKARAVDTRAQRRPFCEMYLRNHDRIDTWGMVDRAAPWVVGGSLDGHDLTVLLELASSDRPIERRSAITAPLYFVKYGDDAEVTRSFEIAARLANDPESVVHNAVGIFIKHAGRRLPEQQRTFLERHAHTMPRSGLRLAITQLDATTRQRYLNP